MFFNTIFRFTQQHRAMAMDGYTIKELTQGGIIRYPIILLLTVAMNTYRERFEISIGLILFELPSRHHYSDRHHYTSTATTLVDNGNISVCFIKDRPAGPTLTTRILIIWPRWGWKGSFVTLSARIIQTLRNFPFLSIPSLQSMCMYVLITQKGLQPLIIEEHRSSNIVGRCVILSIFVTRP